MQLAQRLGGEVDQFHRYGAPKAALAFLGLQVAEKSTTGAAAALRRLTNADPTPTIRLRTMASPAAAASTVPDLDPAVGHPGERILDPWNTATNGPIKDIPDRRRNYCPQRSWHNSMGIGQGISGVTSICDPDSPTCNWPLG